MNFECIRLLVVFSFAVIAVVSLPGCKRADVAKDAPGAKTPGGPRPSEILKGYKLHSPPPLASADDVSHFLDWAGASHVDEREDARKAVASAGSNKDVVQALIEEVERIKDADHTRALLALALLGETRSPEAQAFLAEFAQRPLPTDGPIIEGEMIEQTRAAQLQAKAVDGLAYANDENSNKVVTEVLAHHPSRIVRAEAINAYLWNHQDSDEARKLLAQYVRRDELVFVDRVRRTTGENAESFNRKLDQFLQQHPEAVPPKPDKTEGRQNPADRQRASDVKPPDF